MKGLTRIMAVDKIILVLIIGFLLLGYRGARCEVDVDECAEGLVQCGPGECRNLDGGYT
ncbi:hypothetical protein JYU34_010693 [Plutella xylostella]|uniref:Uncharacterized protein n=1 Tax=Plutella xylostella TaxID=51655 RepID=A0ABQ7QEZ3_PLUXY|nr:hypothetical protein JYU34_010693 [Plutella xylostella]